MITLFLLVAALVCFLIGAAGVAIGRVNVVALGLAFWVITLLLGAVQGA